MSCESKIQTIWPIKLENFKNNISNIYIANFRGRVFLCTVHTLVNRHEFEIQYLPLILSKQKDLPRKEENEEDEWIERSNSSF